MEEENIIKNYLILKKSIVEQQLVYSGKCFAPVHSLTLNGDSEFVTKFNKVSEAFKVYQDLEKQTNEALKTYENLKYCLEQGLPI